MIILVFAVKAQKNVDKNLHFSVGPELSFATGKFADKQSVGTGATVQVSYRVAPATDVTLTTGYLVYFGKSAGAGIKFKSAGVLPIRAGLKYYLTEGLYGQVQTGVGFFSNNGGTAFAFTPAMGYEFDTKSGQAFDVSLKYDGYFVKSSALGAFGIRLAYKF